MKRDEALQGMVYTGLLDWCLVSAESSEDHQVQCASTEHVAYIYVHAAREVVARMADELGIAPCQRLLGAVTVGQAGMCLHVDVDGKRD